MAVNLSNISSAMTTAQSLSNLILVSPQEQLGLRPQLDGGTLGGSFLFNIEGENSMNLSSDITDHYTEDNIAKNDQIALKPERYTVRGYIGELNNVVPVAEKELRILQEKLTLLAAYTPEMSLTALRTYNTAFQAYQTAMTVKQSAISTWNSLNNQEVLATIGSDGLTRDEINQAQTKQQIAFQQLYGYWRSRSLFTVQTPWAIFENMAIENLRVVQEENSSVISDFEITFKMLRFARTEVVPGFVDPSNAIGRTAQQGAKTVNSGVEKLKTSASFSSALP